MLNEGDIDFLFEVITHYEQILTNDFNKPSLPDKKKNEDLRRFLVRKREQSIVLKSKLLRMRDGISIEKDLKKV